MPKLCAMKKKYKLAKIVKIYKYREMEKWK